MKKDDNTTLGRKLACIRKEKKLTQDDVADMLGVKRQTYSAYERGLCSPDSPVLAKIARFFGVSTDSILYDDAPPNDIGHALSYVCVPVYPSVTAISSSEIGHCEAEAYETVPSSLANGGKLIAFRMHGGCMEPRFSENDIVIVRLQPEVKNEEYAAVFIDGEATVRKFKQHFNGVSFLCTNPAYEPLFIADGEPPRFPAPVRIFGRVMELRGKF